MGSAISTSFRETFPRVPKSIMRTLREYTAGVITEEAAYQWYDQFRRQYNDGEIGKTELLRIFLTYFPARDADVLYERLINGYAEDSGGKVDFLTFMKALFHVCPLDFDLKLIPFKMFDKDGDGKVNRDDVRDMMINHYQLTNTVSNPFEAARCYLSEFFGSKNTNTLTMTVYLNTKSRPTLWRPDIVYMGIAAIGNELYNNPSSSDTPESTPPVNEN